MALNLVDCTLRDGGYYNNWDFLPEVVSRYIEAMSAVGVNVIELGLRSLQNCGFRGGFAYSTDDFLDNLSLPNEIVIGVMVNASELLGDLTQQQVLQRLFPRRADESAVDLVRIACHLQEFSASLPAAIWLKERGYQVGFNLMQVAGRSEDEIKELALEANKYPLDVLYFADSMGSMTPDSVTQVIRWLRKYWKGPLGIHTHDNMGLALQNSLRALDEGVSWLDATVTGMGRGPGNARTEELVIELAEQRGHVVNMVPLMALIREFFRPMQHLHGWGTNPYYYLAGKYGIHPTYIQEMLSDSRYDDEDILAAIEHLRVEGGKKFSLNTLDAARHFYVGEPTGHWAPEILLSGREVLLLGTGPGVANHRQALEDYIRRHKPVVLALNTQSAIDADLIDLRVACHPVRLLADCETHTRLPQPLITPFSMLPEDVRSSLSGKDVLDFGLNVQPDTFIFERTCCTTPSSLVVAYALAISTSGRSHRVLMAGFDGYGSDDPRSIEMHKLLTHYQQLNAVPIISVTPTRYTLPTQSIYAL